MNTDNELKNSKKNLKTKNKSYKGVKLNGFLRRAKDIKKEDNTGL